MTRTTVTRTIDAPVERVFSVVADIRNFSQAIEHIERVEFLSESKVGVGTRFRETRNMKGREATVELEVTEYVENDHIRLVSDAHGTIWDTVFTVREKGGATELQMVMDAKAKKLLSKLLNPMLKGMIQKAVEQDLDSVKAYCERGDA